MLSTDNKMTNEAARTLQNQVEEKAVALNKIIRDASILGLKVRVSVDEEYAFQGIFPQVYADVWVDPKNLVD